MALRTFTVEHFQRWAAPLVFDDGECHEPEPFQLEILADVFAGFPEVWAVLPEGNSKTTFIAEVALYGARWAPEPWIPVAASSERQARILYEQAAGFVRRTRGMANDFRCLGGAELIRSVHMGGIGIKVFSGDPKTGDGVIPYPYAIVDELHRLDDMGIYRLWKGKLRKRHAQILGISTAGEPETTFEKMRDNIRQRATDKVRHGAHLRAADAVSGMCMHEWMVDSDEDCSNMEAVKAANPLSTITVESLTEDFTSPTLDLGNWKRLKCNRPTRSHQSAVSDREWDDAWLQSFKIPAGADITLGMDVAFKWDTTAIVPVYRTVPNDAPVASPGLTVLGDPAVLVPPRDGNSLHPDEIKNALLEMEARYRILEVVMDVHRAEDIAAWMEDDLGVTVIDRQQTNKFAVADYEAFMKRLRNGTLKHTGDLGLRAHVLNAIARRLPGGDHRFDRPLEGRKASSEQQDRRVIDALTAAAMAVQHLERAPRKRSVYETRYAKSA